MPPKKKDSGKKSQRPRVVTCEAPHSAMCPPQSQVDPMSLASTQGFVPLLSSHTFPSGVPASFVPPGVPGFLFPPPQLPSSFQHPRGSSFPFPPTQLPSSFQHPGGASFPFPPTQVPSSFQQTGVPSSFQRAG